MNSRYSIFLDDTEIYTSLHQKLPSLYLYGGIRIEEQELKKLNELIDRVKRKYGTTECPLKYNFKDLRDEYKRLNIEHLFDPLLRTSKEWRKELIEGAKEIKYQFVVSCVQKYHTEDKLIKENKPRYTQFAFTYCLQRFGIEQKGQLNTTAEVYSDWPTGNDRRVLQKEYHGAYHHGYTSDWTINYQCGPLNKIGFGDSVNFTIAEESRALQFTDILLGATKELIAKGIVGKYSFGEEMSPYFLNKFRGYPEIIGKGLVVSSNFIYKQMLRNLLGELVKK